MQKSARVNVCICYHQFRFFHDTDCRLIGATAVRAPIGYGLPPIFSMSRPRRMPVMKSSPTEHNSARIVSSLSLMVPVVS